jgi:hypothetical protein
LLTEVQAVEHGAAQDAPTKEHARFFESLKKVAVSIRISLVKNRNMPMRDRLPASFDEKRASSGSFQRRRCLEGVGERCIDAIGASNSRVNSRDSRAQTPVAAEPLWAMRG